MTIREWVRQREINGVSAFSFDELRQYFVYSSDQVIKNELYRLKMQKKILPVYKGFYVIIPVQYAAKNIVPPVYYIEQLMHFLRKPYYICLLSAAEQLGAAHQRPQNLFVMTIPPKSSVSESKQHVLTWVYRNHLPNAYLQTKNSETGTITFSNPELTAIDLVQFEQYVGGLSRVSTVLAELIEITDFSDASKGLFDYTSVATLQRLGFILDHVLEATQQAHILYNELQKYKKRLNYIPLSSRHAQAEKTNTDKRWKININIEIEIDEV